jgi:hypothetical protein
MEPTIPITDDQSSNESGESNSSNTEHSPALQARFNELTATLKAKDDTINKLMEQTTALMTQMQRTAAPVVQEQAPQLPEGVDPNIAKFFKDLVSTEVTKVTQQTQALFGQLASRQDQHDVNSNYAHLPDDVRKEVQGLYTHMRKKYGDANMDDAVRMVMGERALKALGTNNQRAQFNQMPGAARVQGVVPNAAPNNNTNALTPPTQREDWDQLDNKTQMQLIAEFRKKGGSVYG